MDRLEREVNRNLYLTTQMFKKLLLKMALMVYITRTVILISVQYQNLMLIWILRITKRLILSSFKCVMMH